MWPTWVSASRPLLGLAAPSSPRPMSSPVQNWGSLCSEFHVDPWDQLIAQTSLFICLSCAINTNFSGLLFFLVLSPYHLHVLTAHPTITALLLYTVHSTHRIIICSIINKLFPLSSPLFRSLSLYDWNETKSTPNVLS